MACVKRGSGVAGLYNVSFYRRFLNRRIELFLRRVRHANSSLLTHRRCTAFNRPASVAANYHANSVSILFPIGTLQLGPHRPKTVPM